MLTIKEINETLATISRIVLHPKYRSLGLGEKLVKETLPLDNRPYVETMAVIAKYNPFFEKAGMKYLLNTLKPIYLEMHEGCNKGNDVLCILPRFILLKEERNS